MDVRIELVMVPVTDIDRAKAFYVDLLGFHADYDQRVSETLRFVQLTPPGSACSIAIGEGITDKAPGSASIQVVVDDADEARRHLAARGAPVGDVQELEWGRFLFLSDPDGNSWAYQQLPSRL